jgi:drug/metabolite transporter (DMT)-like permease
MTPETQQDQQAAGAGRSALGIMTLAAAALIALGLAIMFIPGHRGLHLVAGICAIVAGLVVLGLAADMRRRFGNARAAESASSTELLPHRAARIAGAA